MRGRAERSRVEQLEDELVCARLFARRLWHTLRVRSGGAVDALLDGLGPDERRAVDAVFDAAETVWERHKVMIEPCRLLLDPAGARSPFNGWPVQDEVYIGRWPDGTTRNLSRDQVLMMGGQDPAPAASPGEEVPF